MAQESAAPCLLDIVVFAGGHSADLQPLVAVEPKNMLRVCNRPLIWYCLMPWIEAGFQSFFICVNEDYTTLRTYLSREFTKVEFYYVLVPLNLGEHPSTTCDAVKAYLKLKESLRTGEVDSSMILREEGVPGEDETSSPIRGGGGGSAGASGGGGGGGSSSSSSNRDPLKAERAAIIGLPRDALLLNCDTILTGIDVDHFVSNFYNSSASVSAMMVRPLKATASPGSAAEKGGAEKGGKKKGGGGPLTDSRRTAFTNRFMCVAYEEEDVVGAVSAGGAQTSATLVAGGMGFSCGACDPFEPEAGRQLGRHHRLHFMHPLDDKPELRITMSFAARRPDLTFAADVVDAHAYLVRHWVLDFIAASAGVPELTVSKHIVPLLARSQHTMVNEAHEVFKTPDQKIQHSIPTHWLYKGSDMTISTLNAAPGAPLPERADSLRVFCTIYDEHPDTPCKIYRINSRENYQAVNQEIIGAKCYCLGLDDVQERAGATSAVGTFSSPLQRSGGSGGRFPSRPSGSAGVAHPNAPSATGSTLSPVSPGPSASAVALAAMLPDNPFTCKERLGSQQVYIVGSFLESVPPPNTYITHSVIGPNVTLGPGARVTDSVILGNVEIGAKAVISGSVIGMGAMVYAERRVTNSIVSPRCIVEQDEHDRIVE